MCQAGRISSITDELLDQVNQLIEGAAVMIVTSCLIPIIAYRMRHDAAVMTHDDGCRCCGVLLVGEKRFDTKRVGENGVYTRRAGEKDVRTSMAFGRSCT